MSLDKKIKFSLFLLLWGLAMAPVAYGQIYVDAGASGSENGLSWTNAYVNLQDALADPNASVEGEIRVAQGTYYPDVSVSNPSGSGDPNATFQLVDGVTILGGFPAGGGELSERDPNLYVTTLSGDIGTVDDFDDNSYHVVNASAVDPNAVLDGFTITGGNTSAISPNDCGGGVFNDGGNATLKNCIIRDNQAMYGGGVFNDNGGELALINCVLSGNTVTNYGGGIYNLNGSDPILINCTLSGNDGDPGDPNGAGIYNADDCSPDLTNCILWNNGDLSETAQIYSESGAPAVAYSCIQDNDPNDANIPFGGAANYNIDDDPLFVDADGADDIFGTADDNLRLSAFSSPCVNAGANSAMDEEEDLGGQPRVVQSQVDMGAYEFQDIYYTLTIVVNGNGQVLKDPDQQVNPAGTEVALTAVPAEGYRVASWSGADDDIDPADPNHNTVTMNSDKTVTVNFEPILVTFELTINVSGDNGTTVPAPGSYVYTEGTEVALQAWPDQYYEVEQWTVTGPDPNDIMTSSDPNIIVTMNGDKEVTVAFQRIQYMLTTQVSAGSGTIEPASGLQDAGSTVNLLATPDQYYLITRWQGTDKDYEDPNETIFNTDPSNTVFMDGNKTVSVEFEQIQYNLTTMVIGGHGSINPGSGPQNAGANVPLTAVPDAGYTVLQWTGTEDDQSTENTNTVVMDEDNKVVTVQFAAVIAPTKLQIKAGKTRGSDSITLSADLQDTLALQDVENAENIIVDIWSDTGGDNDFPEIIPFDPNDIKKNKFQYKKGKNDPGVITLFKFDLTKQTLSLTAKNLDLTGLSSPVLINVTIGETSYVGLIEADESIINGEKKFIPIVFMLGVDDMLRVEKTPVVKVKDNKDNADALTIKGSIAVADTSVELDKQAVSITWGDQTFTVPVNAFVPDKSGVKYKAKKVEVSDGEGNPGLLTATIDLAKCQFNIALKKTTINTSIGSVDFCLSFETPSGVFNECVTVTVP